MSQLVERLAGFFMDGARPREALPPLDDQVGEDRVDLDAKTLAAYLFGCDQRAARPKNGSRTTSPRAVQSIIASASIATGLTVGWSFRR